MKRIMFAISRWKHKTWWKQILSPFRKSEISNTFWFFRMEQITRENQHLFHRRIPRSSLTKFSWETSQDIDHWQMDTWLNMWRRETRALTSHLRTKNIRQETLWETSDRKWQMTLTSYFSKRSKGYFGQKQRHAQTTITLHKRWTSAGLTLTQTEITATKI